MNVTKYDVIFSIKCLATGGPSCSTNMTY